LLLLRLLLLLLGLLSLLLLRGDRRARHRTDGNECKQSEPKLSDNLHGRPPYLSAW
jgi:hypothetical protein